MKPSLRIFSLNTEYGKYSDTFIPYLESIREDFDVFCFQECPNNARDTTVFEPEHDPHLFEKCTQVLPEFRSYYSEFVSESFGIATFVRGDLRQKLRWETYIFRDSGEPFLDRWERNSATKAMNNTVDGIVIVNLHGAWQPGTMKRDTPERILQSEILMQFTKKREEKTVLIWDFNLMPDTQSMKILEKSYTNLITKYGITNTRTAVFTKPRAYADYACVGKDISVQDFGVHLEPIFSDHGFMTLFIHYS